MASIGDWVETCFFRGKIELIFPTRDGVSATLLIVSFDKKRQKWITPEYITRILESEYE